MTDKKKISFLKTVLTVFNNQSEKQFWRENSKFLTEIKSKTHTVRKSRIVSKNRIFRKKSKIAL